MMNLFIYHVYNYLFHFFADIILYCYCVIGGRKEVDRKLSEKLKPSAAKTSPQ